MATLFARHRVADFGRWKRAYDDFEPVRRSMEVTSHSVYRASDDPNDVTVIHVFGGVDDARAFADHPRLRRAMVNAGVEGEPTIWITEEA